MSTSRGLALFAARLLTNKHKDDFAVRLGATLLLGQLNITGPFLKPLNYLIRCFTGLLIEVGVHKIDLTIDAYKEGMKLKDFEKKATELYHQTREKIYDEDEKEKYRQQYLDVISKIGNVGNPK